MSNIRTERANSEVEKVLADIIQNRLNDPRLSEFITVTYAHLSVDFRHCKVGISVLTGDENVVIKQLRKSEGYIKRELVKEVKLPYTPELTFVLDEGAKHADKINEILSTLDIPDEVMDEDNTEKD